MVFFSILIREKLEMSDFVENGFSIHRKLLDNDLLNECRHWYDQVDWVLLNSIFYIAEPILMLNLT